MPSLISGVRRLPKGGGLSSNKVVESQAVLTLALVGRIALFVAVTSVLGRTLAPADFGFVALIATCYTVALEFLDMGTGAVATRRIAADRAAERTTLSELLALRRLFAMVLLAAMLAVALSGYFPQHDQRWTVAAAAFGIFLLHLTTYQVVFQVRQAYRQPVVVGLAVQLGFALASLVAIKLHASGASIALLLVAFQALQVIGIRWVGKRLLGYRVRAAWLQPGTLRLLKAGWLLGLAGVSYKLATYAGGYFLWEMKGPEAFASFNAAQRLLVPLTEMAWLFVTPLIASMSVAIASGSTSFRAQLDAFAKFLLGISALVAVAAYFVGPYFMHLLYGDRYSSGPWSSVGVLRWLGFGCLFALVTPVMAVGELAHGRNRALLFTALAALAVNLAGNSWAVPAYGAEGAAAVLCATEALVFAVLLARCLARGELGIGTAWIGYLLPAALLAAVMTMLASSPLLQFVVACAWGPAALLLIVQLPAQKACRASLAADAAG